MTTTMTQTIDFVIKGGEVKRFHTIRTIQEETVGHHSFLVANLAFLLSPPLRSKEHLLTAALWHDLAEQVLGDIPGNAKKIFKAFEEVAALEEEMLESYDLAAEVMLSAEERRLLKLADSLAGFIFCTREAQLGNTQIHPIRDTYRTYILSLAPFSEQEQNVVSVVIY